MTNPTTLPRRILADALAAVSVGDYVEVAIISTHLQLTGSNLETTVQRSIVTSIDAASTPDAAPTPAVTIPTRLFAAALKSVMGDNITVAVGQTSLTLSSPSSRTTVQQQGRVPTVPTVPLAAWRALSTSAALSLRDVIGTALPAALDDPGRPSASGVRLECCGTSLVAVGLDGARLHAASVASLELSALPSHTLPRGCCPTIVATLAQAEPPKVKAARPKKGAAADVPPPDRVPTVRVAVGSRYVAYEVSIGGSAVVDTTAPAAVSAADTTLVVCRRAPEPFPEWQRIVDNGTAFDATTTLPTAEILGVVRTIPADAVTLTLDTRGVTLDYVLTDETGVRRLGDGTVGLPVPVTGADTVKVSTRYLVDVFVVCGEDVTITLSPGRPLRVQSHTLDAVVMFLR